MKLNEGDKIKQPKNSKIIQFRVREESQYLWLNFFISTCSSIFFYFVFFSHALLPDHSLSKWITVVPNTRASIVVIIADMLSNVK